MQPFYYFAGFVLIVRRHNQAGISMVGKDSLQGIVRFRETPFAFFLLLQGMRCPLKIIENLLNNWAFAFVYGYDGFVLGISLHCQPKERLNKPASAFSDQTLNFDLSEITVFQIRLLPKGRPVF